MLRSHISSQSENPSPSHQRHLPPMAMTSSLPSPGDSPSLTSHFALPSCLPFTSHHTRIEFAFGILRDSLSHAHLATEMKKFMPPLWAQSFSELHVSHRNINTHLATQMMKFTPSLQAQSHSNFMSQYQHLSL